MAVQINTLKAEQVFDSRGYPTIKGTLFLSDGRTVTSEVGQNAHQSKYAAEYLYDENEAVFSGRGVSRAVKYLNELIAPRLKGVDPMRYKDIDLWLLKADPSEEKLTLGANTTLTVSQLVYRAASLVAGVPLYQFINKIYTENFEKKALKSMPSAIFTIISGGRHGVDTLTFQEFSVVPSTALSYERALGMAVELYHELERVFQYRNIFAGVGDSGAYVPNLSSSIDALEILKEAILKRNLKIGFDIFFALDMAAQFFYKSGKYYLSDLPNPLDHKQFLEFIDRIFKEYRLLVLEDAFAEEDFAGWRELMEKMGDKLYILGDDLLATNKKRLEKVAKEKLCNVVDVKISQRGTIWEALQFIAGARKTGMKITISQNAIEANDDFLADFAVGVQADFVKFGAPARGERIGKHNRMLEIERALFSHV